MEVIEAVHLPKFSREAYKIHDLIPVSKKLELDNVNSVVYCYKGVDNKVYGIKEIGTKCTSYSKENTKTDIACSELYFLKLLSKKSSLFPVLIDYEFHNQKLLILSEWIQGMSLTEYIKKSPSNVDYQSIVFQILYSSLLIGFLSCSAINNLVILLVELF